MLDLRGLGQVLPPPPHLMEERLIRQQQEMEEDQRWLEKEERFLVIELRGRPCTPHPAGVTPLQGCASPRRET